jgi:hypothetical protein
MEYSLICESRSGHNFIRANIDSYLNNKLIYNNIESVYIDEYYYNGKYIISNPKVNTPLNIIVIREPLNWLSSLHEQIKDEDKEHEIFLKERIKKYIDIFEEGVNIKNRLKNKFTIYYDSFVTSKEYRESVCNYLGGKYNETKLNIVPSNGKYSSFDKATKQYNGSEMNVTERYINNKNNNLYIKLLKENPLLFDISNKYFYCSKKEGFINSIKN